MSKDGVFRIAMLGTKYYSNVRLVKDTLFKLKQQYKDTPVKIIGAGGNVDINKKIRNQSLEFGFDYVEYNPGYTGRNSYSGMPAQYYNKAYHPSHVSHSLTVLSRACDVMIIFKGEDSIGVCEIAQKEANKLKKKVVVL